MIGMFSNTIVNRRTALATLASAGLGLLAMRWTPAHAGDSQADADALSQLLPRFSEKSRERLLRMLNRSGFSGHISASEVKDLLETEGKSVDALMLGLLPLARTYSCPPISNYHVGAVARGMSESLYFGANLEISGHSLGFSVHAEQAALSNAYMHDDRGVSAIADGCALWPLPAIYERAIP
jgi:hypothetical protein